MGLSSSNRSHFYFVCTNYGSIKDGIGHYTSKIVNELKKKDLLNISVFSSETYNLSKIRLFLSFRMSIELIRLLKLLYKNSTKDYIILEYPFVEYNPLFLIVFMLVKLLKKSNSKIVLSLHEYRRTKIFRKIFTKMLILNSDVVLFTKKEDITSFLNKNIIFRKRIIPANIEPSNELKTVIRDSLNICFFGIINFNTKEINNMIKGWELYLNNSKNNKIQFHFISSTKNQSIKKNEKLYYHFGLEDYEVSKLLQKMQFMVLPLKPKISVNNGSLSVGCIHKCIPVGIFDNEFFDKNFGLSMKNYSIQEFEKIFNIINNLDSNFIEEKSKSIYEYGKIKSIKNSVNSYFELLDIL